MCSMDCTVWPADSSYLQNALSVLGSILAMSSSYFGLVMHPVLQSQTTRQAVLKHKHLLENSLQKQQLTSHQSIQILYCKPDSTSRDGRGLSQLATAVFHESFDASPWTESMAVREGKCGPCKLLPISQFLGYDDVSKPGASARVEQTRGVVNKFYWANTAFNSKTGS